MKLTQNHSIPLSRIAAGSVFTYSGIVYIKSNRKNEGKITAMYAECGRLDDLLEDTPVVLKLAAELFVDGVQK